MFLLLQVLICECPKRRTCDVFALVVSFLKKYCMFKYITIDLFDAFETWRQTLVKAIWFHKKDPCLNVKYEDANLNTMVVALDMPSLRFVNNMQLLNKESLGVWNMFHYIYQRIFTKMYCMAWKFMIRKTRIDESLDY